MAGKKLPRRQPDFSAFSGLDGQPTEAERRLIEACAEGHFARCLELPEEQRIVSAELIVALGMGQFKHKTWPDWALHDRGLMLIGAVVPERLRANERAFPSSLLFDRCRFEQGVSFADSSIGGRLCFDGCTLKGESDFSDAEIAGQFSASLDGGQRAEFINPGQRAIFAQGVKANGWFMLGARVEGEFRINSAKITGQFTATAAEGKPAEFINPSGKAINAEYARIDGGIWLAQWGGTGGANLRGRLSLGHAKIGMRAQLAGAEFDCGEGDLAIDCGMARIEGTLVMPDRLVRGLIDLSRAHCDTLDDVVKGWPEPLGRGCTTCGRETRKRIEADESGKKIEQEYEIQHLVLDGFTYDHLEFPDGKTGEKPGEARKGWLSAQSATALKHQFDPQPWRQCAKTLREMGYDEAAQQISIERRVRERCSDGTHWFARLINRFLHVVADYGYNPWKGVVWCLVVIGFCAALYHGGAALCSGLDGWEAAKGNACGGEPAFVQTKFNDFEEVVLLGPDGKAKKDAEGREEKHRPGYPEFRPLAFSLDLFVPLLDLGADGYWRANTRAWWTGQLPFGIELADGSKAVTIPVGWVLYVLSVVQTIFGSILIAIVITGFTGLLTRDDMK